MKTIQNALPKTIKTSSTLLPLILVLTQLASASKVVIPKKAVARLAAIVEKVKNTGLAPNSCDYCQQPKNAHFVFDGPYQDAKLRRVDFPVVVGGGCQLKTFSLTTYTAQEGAKDDEGVNEFAFPTLETSSSECLQDYGFVQYVKGCIFSYKIDPATQNHLPSTGVWVTHDEKVVQFNFPDWTVDRITHDAMYGVTHEGDRFELYRVPGIPLSRQPDASSLRADSAAFLRSQFTRIHDATQPLGRVFFTMDHPSGGMSLRSSDGMREIHNASVKFKTCVYRIQDIPRAGDPKLPGVPPEQGGPIHCLEWDNQHIYDPISKGFKSSADIHPSCSSSKN